MRSKWISWLLVLAFVALGGCGDRKEKEQAEDAAKQQTALDAGVEAVVYGLPLVIMDITKVKSTNVAKPEGFAAPVNQFIHLRQFPDASFKEVVRPMIQPMFVGDLSSVTPLGSVPCQPGPVIAN